MSLRDPLPGEELPLDTLAEFLSTHVQPTDAEHLSVQQFGSGHSNLTYLISDQNNQEEVVLRRPPPGANIKSGHDMSREYSIIHKLYPHWPKVPKPIVLHEDTELIGTPFYLMEHVKGTILRGAKPKGVTLDESTMRGICDSFVHTLAEIHGLDLETTQLTDFGKPEGYIQRQVEGWTRRWQRAKTDDIPELDAAATWLAEHMPSPQSTSIIHNDFKYDNLILDPDDLTRVIAVLDWEMATIGDPLMDLGTSLAYWVEPNDPEALQQLRFGPTTLPGNDTRQELVDHYAALSGLDVSEILFYYIYGLFKVAVVGQQIYARYKQGLSKDPRFAHLILAVKTLAVTSQRAIQSGKISH